MRPASDPGFILLAVAFYSRRPEQGSKRIRRTVGARRPLPQPAALVCRSTLLACRTLGNRR
jgi:hypothetical protein